MNDALRAWITTVAGAPTSIERLASSSSQMWTVVAAGRGLVVRQITDARWLAADPGALGREAGALDALAATPVRAPHLVASDLDGTETGAPALVMERLAGTASVDGFGDDPGSLAAPLIAIHGIDPTATTDTYAPYTEPDAMWVPGWAADRALWEHALEAARATPPPSASGFIHRDYHAGNVVTADGHITGVIDWVNACRGPFAVDAARAALNLAIAHGEAAVERFLGSCRALDVAVDPHWLLVDALDSIEWYLGEKAVEDWTGPAGQPRQRDQFEAYLGSRLG